MEDDLLRRELDTFWYSKTYEENITNQYNKGEAFVNGKKYSCRSIRHPNEYMSIKYDDWVIVHQNTPENIGVTSVSAERIRSVQKAISLLSYGN
jgi:hypothetical protein